MTDAIVAVRDHTTGELRSTTADRWTSPGGHGAFLQMVLDLHQFVNGSLSLHGGPERGRAVVTARADGEVLVDVEWRTILLDPPVGADEPECVGRSLRLPPRA